MESGGRDGARKYSNDLCIKLPRFPLAWKTTLEPGRMPSSMSEDDEGGMGLEAQEIQKDEGSTSKS